MGEITFSNETVQIMNLASKQTGAQIKDCIVEDDRVVFVVEKGHLGAAIGAKAKNLEKLRKLLKKNVKFVEYDEDTTRFIQNLCKPYTATDIRIKGEGDQSVIQIQVKPRDKSRIIGKEGRNINLIRQIAQRHHTIKDVQIM